MSRALTLDKGARPVYEFRPLRDFLHGGPLLRYADGKWIPDDGEYDLAFVQPSFCYMVEIPYQKNIDWSWTTVHWSAYQKGHPRGNAWHYMLRDGETDWGGDWGSYKHPNRRAGDSGMSKACSIGGGCANGRHVEFKLDDPHIAAGLLRERDTKLVVHFPERPICMYCGPVDLAQKVA